MIRSVMPMVMLAAVCCPAFAVELGVNGTALTLDGKPTFMLGISYYAGLARTRELMARDLDDLSARGVNWIRVWATWDRHDTQPAVDAEGNAADPAMERLKTLVRLADERGMVVDVTLNRGGVITSHEVHLNAVRTIARELRPWRNVYIDVANERNLGGPRHVSIEEVRQLRDAIREIDAGRLVTASDTGTLPREALREYLLEAQLDLITPHLPRQAADPAKTEARVRQHLAWMQEIGRSAPIHLQEPFRRDWREWQPEADDFLTDLRGAVAGGAAGWCLHNGDVRTADAPADYEPRRSFDLNPDRGAFIDTLDAVERDVLDRMAGEVSPG